MPAGRPLEPTGNGRPRWMAAASRTGGTEPGVQVDSSVVPLKGPMNHFSGQMATKRRAVDVRTKAIDCGCGH